MNATLAPTRRRRPSAEYEDACPRPDLAAMLTDAGIPLAVIAGRLGLDSSNVSKILLGKIRSPIGFELSFRRAFQAEAVSRYEKARRALSGPERR